MEMEEKRKTKAETGNKRLEIAITFLIIALTFIGMTILYLVFKI